MILDSFGEWQSLGEIYPSLDWQIFPGFAGDGEIFRLTYSEKSSTHYGYIRAIYWTGSQYIFDNSWKKIFPKDELEILTYPFPKTFRERGIQKRQFQVQKRSWYRKSVTYDRNWTIQLFELRGSSELVGETSAISVSDSVSEAIPTDRNNYPIIGTFDIAPSGNLPIQLL